MQLYKLIVTVNNIRDDLEYINTMEHLSNIGAPDASANKDLESLVFALAELTIQAKRELAQELKLTSGE